MKRTALALLASFAFAATAAHAVEYGQVQPDKSRIAFDYQQMGVAMQGTMKSWPIEPWQSAHRRSDGHTEEAGRRPAPPSPLHVERHKG